MLFQGLRPKVRYNEVARGRLRIIRLRRRPHRLALDPIAINPMAMKATPLDNPPSPYKQQVLGPQRFLSAPTGRMTPLRSPRPPVEGPDTSPKPGRDAMMGSRRWSAEGEKARKHEKDLMCRSHQENGGGRHKAAAHSGRRPCSCRGQGRRHLRRSPRRTWSARLAAADNPPSPSAISPRDRKTPREAKGIPDLEVMSRFIDSNVSATLEGARKEAAESEAATRKGAYETQRNLAEKELQMGIDRKSKQQDLAITVQNLTDRKVAIEKQRAATAAAAQKQRTSMIQAHAKQKADVEKMKKMLIQMREKRTAAGSRAWMAQAHPELLNQRPVTPRHNEALSTDKGLKRRTIARAEMPTSMPPPSPGSPRKHATPSPRPGSARPKPLFIPD